ncbi:hypothetical protein LZQ00_05970 [Sphingobacterium sp. SRCM116780]|uniref:DNA topoisomerase IB n=1 Tax=Sphingobacterium sp. SRCM116780 TaxID=2907623 RepID=UPI001F21D6E3|nr:hypothetical protein [Sphingobacterium sp. SRCM116780]UIR57362.1 hypothetical protein LZQ00_05970 [Sphingobacterium sp. SRCM116780]
MATAKGYKRIKFRKSFIYLCDDGTILDNKKALNRIVKLVIPPNWNNVWISAQAKSNLQAYGFDIKGRKQYIYHAQYTAKQQSEKFDHTQYAGKHLQKLRKISTKHLRQDQWNTDKLCALAFKIMDSTLIRVGNSRYTLENKSYGLSTLEKRHVKLNQNSITLAFTGKKGVFQKKTWVDKRIASYLTELMQFRGKQLFCVGKKNTEQVFCGRQLNAYLKEYSEGTLTCKSIRIWGASREAFGLLLQETAAADEKQRIRQLNTIIKHVAQKLGNTKTVAQKYYVHPHIQATFLAGQLPHSSKKLTTKQLEQQLVQFLQQTTKHKNKPKNAKTLKQTSPIYS